MYFFGTETEKREMKERIEKQKELREMAYKTVSDSTEYLHKILGTHGSKEYWDWRIKFDMERYQVTH